jgi:hypothetical protein
MYPLSRATVSAALAMLPTLLSADIMWNNNAYVKNESALFTHAGSHHAAGNFAKFENTFHLFLNADINEQLSAHGDFKVIYDGAGVNEDYKGHHPYSQHDYVRELYLDYNLDKTYLRLGKQQVVWGTADGIKLLDIINPVDMREFSQNTMEDSRIPVWIAKIERDLNFGGNLQAVIAQPQSHKIPGLTSTGDVGQAFIMRGVDTITGSRNGFLNLVPAIGGTARAFTLLAHQFSEGRASTLTALGGEYFSVQDFIDGFSPFCQGSPPALLAANLSTCANMLNYVAQSEGLGNNQNQTQLVQPEFDANRPDSAFEYMSLASFATFDSFAGAQSKYVRDYPADYHTNLGLRFANNIGGGAFNYSLNYLYHYNPNPALSLHWQDRDGNPLTSYIQTNPGINGGNISTVRLRKADGSDFIAADALGNRHDGEAVLVFKESLYRSHSIGAAFDTHIDTKRLGAVVLRGEFLFARNGRMPVIDRAALAIGDLANALRSEKSNTFNYVVGADITILTNLLISPQWIHFWNLDHIDEGQRYSADPALMHLSNDLRKARAHKNMASLYLSKPFGASQQGRINNLTIVEDHGGYWNRLDMEYSVSDQFILSWEWNHYHGNRNSLFGQMRDASNIQIGFKYLLDAL